MGQLITTVAGGAIGFAIGGPLGAQIGMTLGGMIGSTLFGPTIKGPRLNDLKVSASTYGSVIPEIFGTIRLGGNMIWTSGIKETKKTQRAGKGGPKQTTYTYDATFAVGLCKGPIDDILRVWADGKIIYDATQGASRTPVAVNGSLEVATLVLGSVLGRKKKDKKNNFSMRVYKGTEDQLPDSLIEANKGAGNVSAHRGIAYAVFEKMQLEDYGNRIPQLTFEITKSIVNAFPSLVTRTAENTRPVRVASRRYYPDFETGKLLGIEPSTEDAAVINMDTMQEGIVQPAIDYRTSGRFRLLQGLSLWVHSPNLRNSSPIEFFDINSGAKVASWGNESNSLKGFVSLENNTQGYGNLGEFGYCRYSTKFHLIATTWTRVTWGFNGSEIPIFYDPATPFEPTFYLEGRTGTGSSDIIGYRGANGRLELLIWYIGGSATHSVQETADGPVWVSSDDWSREQVNLNPFVGDTLTVSVCLYDRTDDCIFVVGSHDGETCTFKWNRSTETFKFAVKHPGVPLPDNDMRYSRIEGGTFGYGSAGFYTVGRFIQIDLQDGSLKRDNEFTNQFGSRIYFGRDQHWDDETGGLLAHTRDEYRKIMFGDGARNVNVASVVRELCLASRILTDEDIDVSQLRPDELTGYIIDRESSPRDNIKQLATGFLFDGYESDYTLKFKSRGNAPIVTIPEDWLARSSDGILVKETLTQELEMPMRVTVNYYDITRDHQQGSQSQKRISGPIPSMWSQKEDIIELPITWTPDLAKQSADKLLKMAWSNRTTFDLDLPWRYMKYDPTDVAVVNLDNGTSYTMRISESTIGVDFTVRASGQSEKATAYDSDAVGAPSNAPEQFILGDYPAFPIIINTPLLRDIDYDTSQNSACYISAGSESFSFNGAVIYMDDGYDYVPIGTATSESILGLVTNQLPKTKAYESTDETTVLVVALSDGTNSLESVSMDDMLNNFVNAALVGDEVIQFRDAVKQPSGVWHLSGILRARRGTNYAVNTHKAGERFVFLDPAVVTQFVRPPTDYSITRNFKATAASNLLEEAAATPATLLPRDLQPYTPEDIKISDDDTTITITMSRRSRVISPLRDGTGVIHYKEGEKLGAKISYKLWNGLEIGDIDTITLPDRDDNIPVFDAGGNDLPLAISYPLADLGGATKFLLRLAEIGIVEGIPKFIAFERLGTNRWNAVDLY